eukprot:2873923-Ditylum_brightwellii.AAC.1
MSYHLCSLCQKLTKEHTPCKASPCNQYVCCRCAHGRMQRCASCGYIYCHNHIKINGSGDVWYCMYCTWNDGMKCEDLDGVDKDK